MTDTLDRRDHGTDSPWMKPRFIVAAVVVALIVVLGVALAILGPGGAGKPAAPPVTKPSAATTQNSGSDSACGLPAGDQTVPRVAPADTRWQLVGTMAAPTAPSTYGPGTSTNTIPTCFAHSPTGALYAAVNFIASGTAHPSAEVLRVLAADAAVREQAIKDAEAAGSTPQVGQTTRVQVSGFRFLDATQDQASMQVVLRNEVGGLTAVTENMVWQAGDWKFSVPLDPAGLTQQVPDLSGFAAWSGA